MIITDRTNGPVLGVPPQFGATPSLSTFVQFAQEMKTRVFVPMDERPAPIQSSLVDLSAALREGCGVDPSEQNVSTFLQVTRCWLDEAFGWWAEVRATSQQTVVVGQALITTAVNGIANLTRQLGELKLDRPGRRDQIRAEIAAFERQKQAGTTMIDVGQQLIAKAIVFDQQIRAARNLDTGVRDVILTFNVLVEEDKLSLSDPAVQSLRGELVIVANSWRKLCLRLADAAFVARTFARRLQPVLTGIIQAQFNLASLVPSLFVLVDDLRAIIADLLATLDLLSLPGRALQGLSDLFTGFIGDLIAKPGGEVVKLFGKTALIIGGFIVVLVGGLVALRHYGVIGEVSLSRRKPTTARGRLAARKRSGK